ncbi:MAG: cytochrome b [Stappiaceae bacterium]
MIRNTANSYGVLAIAFHWIMAFLILFMLGLGLYMHEQDITAQRTFELYQLHKSFGFVALAMVILRLIWRLTNPTPALEPGMKAWEKALANLAHTVLYVLMFILPLSGWMMVSASPWDIPTIAFNVLHIPHLPIPENWGTRESIEALFKQAHGLFAWLLILTLVAHIAAALKHHFISRDNTLRRMMGFRSK